MENTLNTELIAQYAHIWRVFERLVNDFDDAHGSVPVERP